MKTVVHEIGKVLHENILDQLRVHNQQGGKSALVESNKWFALVFLVNLLRPLRNVVFHHKLRCHGAKNWHRLDEFHSLAFPVAKLFCEEPVCQIDQQAKEAKGDVHPQHFLKIKLNQL
jgi:hypothetical protein